MAILIYVVVTLWSLRVLSELAIFTPRLLTLHCWVIYQWCLRHFAELAKFNHLRDILVAARCAQIFKNRGSIASILHHGNSCPTSPGIYIASKCIICVQYQRPFLSFTLYYTFPILHLTCFCFQVGFPWNFTDFKKLSSECLPIFFPCRLCMNVLTVILSASPSRGMTLMVIQWL